MQIKQFTAFFILWCTISHCEAFAHHAVERWKIYEVTLKGSDKGNPFVDTELYGCFYQGEDTLLIKGFYDGGGVYKIRFSPPKEGNWHYHTISNQKNLHRKRGSIVSLPPQKSNRGPVTISNLFSFAYADGTPYAPFGTTLYAWVHQPDSLAQLTLHTLSKGYFNKVRMCLFPKSYWWNQGEPEIYPFEGDIESGWDFKRFNPLFFQNLEKRIAQLDSLGIESDLILFHPYDRWGFSKMDSVSRYHYLDYITARLSAYKNIWWSMANEFDFLGHYTMADWDSLIAYLAEKDPYARLRSIHNGAIMYDYGNPQISHVSIQTNDISSIPLWRKNYQRPVIIDECGYEGNVPWSWGQLTPETLVSKFWEGIVKGGYVSHGETYLTHIRTNQRIEENDDLLWWSKGGILRGKSPERIAFLREIVASGCGSQADNDEDYLLYFGTNQPALHLFEFSGDAHYEITIIDTWNMTMHTLEKNYSGYSLVPLPQKPYIAVRVRKR